MRKNGVLLSVTSLPSPYGIGTLGKAAYDFIDFLKRTDQSVWQILPLGPTGYGDSPYQSYSTFAGNPYMIDLDLLAEEGLLLPEEFRDLKWFDQEDQVDYGRQYEQRFPILEKAAERFLKNPPKDFEQFQKDNYDWLEDYALFMALKDAQGGKPWKEWDPEYRRYDLKKIPAWKKENKARMDYYKVLQYLFFKQWNDIRKYAAKNGIEILGDLPIYVAPDSVDAWSNPQLFRLDENGMPSVVAGCPPDGFSADGQLWGNPIYDWDNHRRSNYAWWINRIDRLTQMMDILRIDHFRGFDSYYEIPADATTAKNGVWKTGPGIELFKTMEKQIGKKNIVAEDLGYLTDSVKQLLAETGYPGMMVLEFAFDSRDGSGSEYLPYNYPKNSVAYAGTHDNDTIRGWFDTISPEDKEYACQFMDAWNPEEYNWEMMRTVVASPSDLAVLQMQDLLNLDSSARMNTPGKLGGNWIWRLKPDYDNQEMESGLKYITDLYGRAPRKKKTEDEVSEAAEATEDSAD